MMLVKVVILCIGVRNTNKAIKQLLSSTKIKQILMKRVLMLFIIFLITSWSVSAQDTDKRSSYKLKYGIKGGINIANVDESPTPKVDTKNLIGITGGVFITIPIDSNFSIQPELLYSQMGATVSASALYGGDQKLVLSYIDLPILAKYDLSKSIGLYAGPQIGYLNSAVIKSANSLSFYPNNDFSSHVKKIDVRAIIGVDVYFSEVMYLSGRYQLGLMNASSSTDGVTDKNNAFTITLNFPLSH